MTLKQIQILLTKKMDNAKRKASEADDISIQGISEFAYYSGVAKGILMAKEIVGKLDKD